MPPLETVSCSAATDSKQHNLFWALYDTKHSTPDISAPCAFQIPDKPTDAVVEKKDNALELIVLIGKMVTGQAKLHLGHGLITQASSKDFTQV